ncbi:MAG: hypothetical protein FGM61_09755, partial [Sediminibacterium sp.]|nr:hypothetical protein [Sediminibacterium sp.]
MDILGRLQYYFAPLTAPVPTAIAVGTSLHNSLLLIPGTPGWLALLGAVTGAIAIELGGGLMFTAAGKAFALRRWGALKVAALGAVMYVAIVIYSIWVGGDSRPIVGSVLVTLIAYLGKAVFDFLRETQEIEHNVKIEQSAADEREMKIIDAQRKLAAAEARKAKAEIKLQKTHQLRENLPTAPVHWPKVPQSDYEWLAQASTPEIQARYNVPPRTAL